MQPFSAAAAFGCVQAHDSDYVSVYDHVQVHVQVQVQTVASLVSPAHVTIPGAARERETVAGAR